jgi:hypothetical protein
MPLNIKDPTTEKSVRELAALTGETVTTAVHRADPRRSQQAIGVRSLLDRRWSPYSSISRFSDGITSGRLKPHVRRA